MTVPIPDLKWSRNHDGSCSGLTLSRPSASFAREPRSHVNPTRHKLIARGCDVSPAGGGATPSRDPPSNRGRIWTSSLESAVVSGDELGSPRFRTVHLNLSRCIARTQTVSSGSVTSPHVFSAFASLRGALPRSGHTAILTSHTRYQMSTCALCPDVVVDERRERTGEGTG
jgi:hypothetical protein